MSRKHKTDETEHTDSRPALRPDQFDHIVLKVATAIAVAHFGDGADPAGYMQDARTFVGAALALEDGIAEARDLPDPAEVAAQQEAEAEAERVAAEKQAAKEAKQAEKELA